jgi:hypothetical protein
VTPDTNLTDPNLNGRGDQAKAKRKTPPLADISGGADQSRFSGSVGDLGWTLEAGSNLNANDFAEKSLCKALPEQQLSSVSDRPVRNRDAEEGLKHAPKIGIWGGSMNLNARLS